MPFRSPRLLCAIGAIVTIAPAAAQDVDFFGAALCDPPYTTASATAFYNAAEKITRPEMAGFSAIYTLPENIGRDGFHSSQVVFTSTFVGVLIEGERADELARHYRLSREKPNALLANSKGYKRTLADADQPTPELGTVSIVARETTAMPGKTLLGCELLSHADAQALKAFER